MRPTPTTPATPTKASLWDGDAIFIGGQNATAQSRSMGSVKTHRGIRTLFIFVAVLLVVTVAALILTPWQQTITGYGKVTVFSPMDRPQGIEAQISGRVETWLVREGEKVRRGQLIARLRDIDPKFMDPQIVERMTSQRAALVTRRAAVMRRIGAVSTQAGLLTESRDVALPTQQQRIGQARNRIIAAQQSVAATRQNLTTTQQHFDRVAELERQGLRSTRDLQMEELNLVRAKTAVESAEASLREARQAEQVAQLDLARVGTDLAAGVSNVMASEASARETLAGIESDILKLDVELSNIAIRRTQQEVRAPIDGRVVRLMPVGRGETVKAGDVLATVVPETQDAAVALYISDNDAPIVTSGDPVRLQFAGWPAIQFAGWPVPMVGTFAGRVAVVDALDDGSSRFRVLVRPDWQAIKAGKEQAWPPMFKLRPGSKVSGWILLKEVPLWFELWRQFNAFPPVVDAEKLGKEDDPYAYGKQDLYDLAPDGYLDNEKKKADIKRKVKK